MQLWSACSGFRRGEGMDFNNSTHSYLKRRELKLLSRIIGFEGPCPSCCKWNAFLKASEWVKLLSHVQLFATPWTVAYQAPQSMEFSRQEYWSGLPLPSPGDLPDPGIVPGSPELQADTLPSEPPGKPPKSKEEVKLDTSWRAALRLSPGVHVTMLQVSAHVSVKLSFLWENGSGKSQFISNFTSTWIIGFLCIWFLDGNNVPLWENVGFPSGSMVNNLLAIQEMWETQFWSLTQEHPLEETMAHTPAILSGKSHGQRSLDRHQATVHGVAKSQIQLKWLSTVESVDHWSSRSYHHQRGY